MRVLLSTFDDNSASNCGWHTTNPNRILYCLTKAGVSCTLMNSRTGKKWFANSLINSTNYVAGQRVTHLMTGLPLSSRWKSCRPHKEPGAVQNCPLFIQALSGFCQFFKSPRKVAPR